ncbi:MAG: neuraminidase, partial [Tannerellaceae bacterium]|nr:neuraminidase [Tannerellaceae bacterium]
TENKYNAYFIFRDEERDNKVSLAYSPDLVNGKWIVEDLTRFPVDSWEPSHDTELWKQQEKLHLYVQRTGQGDGERTVEIEPQPVYVLEVNDK